MENGIIKPIHFTASTPLLLAIYDRESPDRRRQIEEEDGITGTLMLEAMRTQTINEVELDLQNHQLTANEILRDARSQYTRKKYDGPPVQTPRWLPIPPRRRTMRSV